MGTEPRLLRIYLDAFVAELAERDIEPVTIEAVARAPIPERETTPVASPKADRRRRAAARSRARVPYE